MGQIIHAVKIRRGDIRVFRGDRAKPVERVSFSHRTANTRVSLAQKVPRRYTQRVETKRERKGGKGGRKREREREGRGRPYEDVWREMSRRNRDDA